MNSYYLILIIPALLISMWAQLNVQKTFSKYSKIENMRRYTGADIARRILDLNNLLNIKVNRTDGKLTDNFNPSKQEINLSADVYQSTSLSAIGVAAHEAGHAIQYKEDYSPIRIRKMMLPVASIGSNAGPIIVILGIVLSYGILIDIGIILFSVAVLFYIMTLPVEYNASKRATRILTESGLITEDEVVPVRKVLHAAALTYVASALSAVLSLVRLLLISRNRR
ncbi:MAG: zinc metallopeptidase [Clostridia bacterium]|nr:zinc metallopeptidase [Clostridia bacterium]